MKFKKLTARFEAGDLALAEELICNIFFSFDLKGVVCDVPIQEPDEGFGTATLPLPEFNAIIGFIPDIDSAELTIGKIKDRLLALSDMGIVTTTLVDTVDEKDWANAWKEFFNVTRITDRIVVKPDWKPYTPNPEEIIIHIDPGMAFGTGTHPTTAMCLELLETHMTEGRSLLDVGCGSGILMIAAAGLGAGQMTGIDIDPTAVDVSRENLVKNNVPQDRYSLCAATLDQVPETKFDVITANIIAQVIVHITGDIRARLAPSGTAILSGIITERENDVLSALDAHSLTVVQRTQQDEWVALAVRHLPPSSRP